MLKTRQCLLGIRTFLGVTSRIWSFILYILRKHLRTIIQYQTVRYDTLPLSPISRNRLNAVKRKILVLDLDETLIHSHHDGVLRPTVRPGTPPDFILKFSPSDNAIPIKSWFSDPSDTALLNLLPMLDALRFTSDVRSVLSRNLHQHRLW
ncbi:CTD nuclear envelope phosphatase 1A-like [Sinocyclocheilus rhinocerous]|uniref:CTD nuclear envelope phosphatase 1A-like n=1 Tax=Sinocyclocheilus rhinocerous TaxID=307959 RepID=UPI0007B84949|nr:PREDICTED: CTD nuclear envelope phosphatase 1A-like [Sinocyclocheilus rhinocerous]